MNEESSKKGRFRQLDELRNPQKMIHNIYYSVNANQCIDGKNFLCAWQQGESFAKLIK